MEKCILSDFHLKKKEDRHNVRLKYDVYKIITTVLIKQNDKFEQWKRVTKRTFENRKIYGHN